MIKRFFNRTLNNYGTKIRLRRRNSDGTYSTTFEEHLVRMQFAGRRNALTNVSQEGMEGLFDSVQYVFYFKSEALPKSGDLIYMKTENYDKAEWYVYSIEFAVAQHANSGILQYWTVGATRFFPV